VARKLAIASADHPWVVCGERGLTGATPVRERPEKVALAAQSVTPDQMSAALNAHEGFWGEVAPPL
jgi:hypothetical protein